MSTQACIYLTTPIFYLNAEPHIGHFYTVLVADVLARFWRKAGARVKFVTGTDEHGSKVSQTAEKKGMTPQDYVDKMVKPFQKMVADLHATPDDFIRTTEPRHKASATAFWQTLESKGQIYLGSYAGWYAVRDEAFYEESELTHGVAPSGASVEWVEEPCYFFRLSHWEKPLLQFYAENPEAIGPKSRYNETLSFIKGGLRDLAVSRSRLSWGIPIPGVEGHVMYVWIDALTNYLTVLGYPDIHSEAFQTFWPHVCHLVGKDILRFHTVYWPAFLMAAGIAPPKRVFAHGWWTRDKQKISKSLGNAINPWELLEQYGLDPVRYFFVRTIRLGQDGDFSEEALNNCTHHELADTLGNLVMRVLSFLQKHTGGKIPVPGQLGLPERTLRLWGQNRKRAFTQFMAEQRIDQYLEEIFLALQQGNQYMTQLAPWVLCKGDEEDLQAMGTGLHTLVHFLHDVALFLWPIMPDSCEKILQQVGCLDVPDFKAVGASLDTEKILPVPVPLFAKGE